MRVAVGKRPSISVTLQRLLTCLALGRGERAGREEALLTDRDCRRTSKWQSGEPSATVNEPRGSDSTWGEPSPDSDFGYTGREGFQKEMISNIKCEN